MALSYVKRFTRLIFGLFLYAVGIYLSVQANIGLAPWEALSMGLSKVTSISFGDIVVYTGIVIIIIDFFLKEKIGFGTLLNAVLIGKFLDVIAYFEPLSLLTNFAGGIALLLMGQVVISVASFLYIGSALGCGPRDALMVALCKRFPECPIGIVRAGLEGSVLFIGFLLGAKVGLGTVIAVFGIGFIMQWTFRLLRFDVKGIQHEDFADTWRCWRNKDKEKKQSECLP